MSVILVEMATAHARIREAIDRMLGKRQAAFPYVFIEPVMDPESKLDPFVQFCGSQTEPLKIDCPPLRIIARPIAIEDAADHAVRMLSEQGVGDTTLLRVIEGEQAE